MALDMTDAGATVSSAGARPRASRRSARVPLVVNANLERPAILTPLTEFASAPDVPNDTADPVFRAGHGLRY